MSASVVIFKDADEWWVAIGHPDPRWTPAQGLADKLDAASECWDAHCYSTWQTAAERAATWTETWRHQRQDCPRCNANHTHPYGATEPTNQHTQEEA